ncbi:unnamed protein product [Orchesella dallaii]|uniref:Uncharacterized protein n=1 Tax=Orchesella dallaii TaxID=48710 RepID=A0ABP1REA2_9HEXA
MMITSDDAGLLASCQLTNLLLYQIIQQRQQAATNPFLSLANANLQGLGSNLNLNVASGLPLNSGAVGGSLINPFPAINQNLIFPAATLTTYTTTSTFVTKLTTTAVLTIPLLFGNKPVPTTITRTKTYDVTTSEVKTLTSTVKPTFVTQVIAPTAALQSPTVTASPSLNDVDEDDTSLVTASVIPKKYQSSKVAVPEYEDEEPSTNPRFGSGTLSSKLSKSNARVSAKRRKPARSSQSQKPSSATTSNGRTSNRDRDYQDRDAPAPSRYGSTAKERDDYYETEYQPYGTSGKSNSNTNSGGFSKRKYGSIYEDDAVAVDEDPAAAQYPDDYSYYTKRLKRGEQYGDEETNDREYLLEPSTDGDFSSNYQKVERCPPIPKVVDPETVTVTRTETRTVTKFLGQSTLASNINLSGASRSFETPKPARKRTRSRNRDRSGTAVASSDQSAAYSAPAPTSERPTRGTTEDSRAHILSRSRSRYNSNSNNYQQQQPNYDYYRG